MAKSLKEYRALDLLNHILLMLTKSLGYVDKDLMRPAASRFTDFNVEIDGVAARK